MALRHALSRTGAGQCGVGQLHQAPAVLRSGTPPKMHTLIDRPGSGPGLIHVADGSTHEVIVLDDLVTEPGALCLMDRRHRDFSRRFAIRQAQALPVTRASSNTLSRRRYSHPVDRSTPPVSCDPMGVLSVFYSCKDLRQRTPHTGQGRHGQAHRTPDEQLCIEPSSGS